MINWTKTNLGDCCEIVSGSTPSTNVESFWNGNICWVTPKDLSHLNGAYISNTPRKLTQSGLDSCGAAILPSNSVLFSSRAPIGHVAINSVPMATNQGFKSFIPKDNRVYSKFLYHWLRKNRAYLEGLGNGATFKEVSKSIVSRVEILLPPIAEQKRIAEILDRTQSLISKRKEAIALLDILTQSIFIEMFGDNSPLESKWNTVSFGDLLEVLTDYHANGSYEILRDNVVLKKQVDYALMVRTTDLENNNFDDECIYIDKKAYDFLSKSKVYGGEIIINKIGSAGKVYLMPYLDRPVSLGMNAFLIRLNNKVNTSFIYYFLTSSYGKEAIDKNVKGAVTKTITKEAIRGIKTPVPPLPLQKEFAQRVEAVEKLKATHHASLSELQALFASLQHR